MPVTLIQVPYHMGREDEGPGRGPASLVAGGAVERLARLGVQFAGRHASVRTACEFGRAKLGVEVEVEAVARREPFADELSAIVDVARALAGRVASARRAGRLPLVLAGNCNSALGTVTGCGPADTGIVWFDAHGDYNTPETTLSGWFEGMPLAVINGQCHADLWRGLGNTQAVPEAWTLLAGVRDLDPPEREFLEQTAVTVVEAEVVRRQGLAAARAPALDALAQRVEGIYLHLDIDALDPADAPGVDMPAPVGLTLADMREAIGLIGARFAIRAAALTTYNPEHDSDGRTLQTALALLEAVVAARRS